MCMLWVVAPIIPTPSFLCFINYVVWYWGLAYKYREVISSILIDIITHVPSSMCNFYYRLNTKCIYHFTLNKMRWLAYMFTCNFDVSTYNLIWMHAFILCSLNCTSPCCYDFNVWMNLLYGKWMISWHMFVGIGMSWKFDLLVYAPHGHTPLRTMQLLTYVDYPTTWWCNIFSHAFCNLVIHLLELSLMMSFSCDVLHGINYEWRWFVFSTPNYASFHMIKHTCCKFLGGVDT